MSTLPPAQIPGVENFELIGRGGFSRVYRARQPRMNRDVAVKVLELRADTDAAKVFERECRTAGGLGSHPNIITIYDSGVDPAGVPWIVMPYFRAGSLDARLKAVGPLPWQEALDHCRKVATAIAEAHRAGVVHRDIKPENVLLSEYGEPVLADFGIAQISNATSTASGLTLTLLHAAPEVIDNHSAGPPSDVYSLGSTLFTLLAGHAPFQREGDAGITALLARVLRDAPPDLRPRGVPAAVCELVESTLRKDPNERPTAVEFAERAGRLLGSTDTGPIRLDPATPMSSHTVVVPSLQVPPAGVAGAAAGAGAGSLGGSGAGVAASPNDPTLSPAADATTPAIAGTPPRTDSAAGAGAAVPPAAPPPTWTTPAPPPGSTPEPKKGKGKKVALAIGAIVAVLAIAGGGFALSRAGDDKVAIDNPSDTSLVDTTDVTDTTEVPDTTEVTDTTEVADTTEVPDTTEVTDTTEGPDTTFSDTTFPVDTGSDTVPDDTGTDETLAPGDDSERFARAQQAVAAGLVDDDTIDLDADGVNCLAPAVVDELGVDRVLELDANGFDVGGATSDFNVALYRALGACIDNDSVRGSLAKTLSESSDGVLTQAAAECFVRELLRVVPPEQAQVVFSGDFESAPPELQGQLLTAIAGCVGQSEPAT